MKNILGIIILLNASMAFALSAKSVYRGYKYGTLKSAKVVGSAWLDEKIEKVSRTYDFHENVSYVGEDWDEVTSTCGWSDEEAEERFDYSEVYVKVDFNKIVNRRGQTKGYIIYLFAEIEGDCDVERGVYVIDRAGNIVHDDGLWESTGLGFTDFLSGEYIVNDPMSEF